MDGCLPAYHRACSHLYWTKYTTATKASQSAASDSDPLWALMVQRSPVCVSNGNSPAQLMQGRPIRTALPVLPKHLEPSSRRHETVQANDAQAKTTEQHDHDIRDSPLPLRPLEPGEKVLLLTDNEQRLDTTSTFTATPGTGIVPTKCGITLRHNRRHLRPVGICLRDLGSKVPRLLMERKSGINLCPLIWDHPS